MTVTTIAVLLLLFAALHASLSIPLIRGRIPPNWWYGLRSRATVHDASLWYPANRFAARQLLVSSVVQGLTAVLLMIFREQFSPGSAGTVAVSVVVVTIAITVVRSFRFLSRLKEGRRSAS